MKQTFHEYLLAIGVTQPIQDRIEIFFRYFERIFKEEIIDIQINDYVDQDGSRRYQDLRIYAEHMSMIAHNFMTQIHFAGGPFCKIKGAIFEAEDYDFNKAKETSRLQITVVWSDGTDSIFRASKENCDFLMKIYEKYIAPLFKTC